MRLGSIPSGFIFHLDGHCVGHIQNAWELGHIPGEDLGESVCARICGGCKSSLMTKPTERKRKSQVHWVGYGWLCASADAKRT